MMNNGVVKDLIKVIRDNNSFFITSHVRPDGDSIGSQLALASFLKRSGKTVSIANVDKIPSIYEFLSGHEEIRVTSGVEGDFDAAFFLDCSCLSRAKNIIDVSEHVRILINIDHHIDNEFFGNFNYVKKDASSVSELVYNIIMQSSLDVSKDEAECLYVGIMTDTGRFQESNTSMESHLIAADLLKRGVSASEVANRVYRAISYENIRLLQKVLETIEFSVDKRIASLVINQAMYKETGTTSEDTEGIIEYARNIKGVDVGVLFRETSVSNQYKVSLRSREEVDVNKAAKMFDGGGHRNAAGCMVNGNIAGVKEKIFKAVTDVLDRGGYEKRYHKHQ